jgi:putative ABC transport system substrate-binding protein
MRTKFLKEVANTCIKRFAQILILAIAIIVTSCGGGGKNKKVEKKPFNEIKVKIITFISHEVMDEIAYSTKNYLVDSMHFNKLNVEIFNPNGKKDEIAAYVKALNSNNTDVIISISTPATLSVIANRHPSIPVVYSFVSDTTALNLAKEKNICGISNILDYKKGFELFKKVLPEAKTIGVIYNPNEPNSIYSFNEICKAAEMQSPKIKVVSGQFTTNEEISVVASSLNNVDAYYVGGDNKLVANFDALLSVAKIKKKAVFASDEGSVKKGAIAAYSIDYKIFGTETAKLTLERLDSTASFRKFVMYSVGREVRNIQYQEK